MQGTSCNRPTVLCLTYGSTPYVYLPTTVYSLMSVFTDRSAQGSRDAFAQLRGHILSLKLADGSPINQDNKDHFYLYNIIIALLVQKLPRHKEYSAE
jgi:hypothetical protein